MNDLEFYIFTKKSPEKSLKHHKSLEINYLMGNNEFQQMITRL